MASLNWQDVQPTSSAEEWHESAQPKGIMGFIVGIMSGAAFSLFLMGLIVGYILANFIRR